MKSEKIKLTLNGGQLVEAQTPLIVLARRILAFYKRSARSALLTVARIHTFLLIKLVLLSSDQRIRSQLFHSYLTVVM